jgi:sarcosine oxidase, subunit gamma
MLEKNYPINEIKNFNNFSMEENKSIQKINLRGNPNNKGFTSKVGKMLGIILPLEVGKIAIKEEISIICTGPNEWLIVSNKSIEENESIFELENILYENISKKDLGAVTNVTDQFVIFSLKGSNIYEVLSKSSPFNLDTLLDNTSAQTLLNNIDITIVKKNNENIELLVRRSFSEHLWGWIKDSANLS